MNIGDKIKNCRLQQKLTQKELGNMMNVSQQMIGQWEKDGANLSLNTIRKIATALNVPLASLLDDGTNELINLTTIQDKLSKIGHNVVGDDVGLCILYPDGYLIVTENQLLELNKQNEEYLKFQLEQLKQQNIENFKLNN